MGATLERSYASVQSKIRYLPFQRKVNKYNVNVNFFKTPTPKMAYTLGLIASDGNVCHTGNAHMLHLASDDLDIIEKVRVLMTYGGPIHQKLRPNGKTSYSLRICDQTIFKDLHNLGITERKSLTFIPPKLPSKLDSHFIRGYFDGDGSVCAPKNPKYPSMSLAVRFYTASLPMAEYLYSKAVALLGSVYKGKINKQLVHENNYYYILSFGYGPAKKLFKYMYKESNGLYMDRKYNKFIEGLSNGN